MENTSKTKRRDGHGEIHRSRRAGWLRAAVLGADDAIVSTASLMIGVAASTASKEAILISGVAGLVAGSMSMAVGEYVSVSSQRDAEQADIDGLLAEYQNRILPHERQLVQPMSLLAALRQLMKLKLKVAQGSCLTCCCS